MEFLLLTALLPWIGVIILAVHVDRLTQSLAKLQTKLSDYECDNYMPCGKEKLSPVEQSLLITEYLGVEFYGGVSGPCYVAKDEQLTTPTP
jgi:hypothetical protein